MRLRRVSEDGRTATLTLKGKQLVAQLLTPGRFEYLPSTPLTKSANPPGQSVNTGIRKLAIHLPGVTETRVAVLLGDADAKAKIVPLAEWW